MRSGRRPVISTRIDGGSSEKRPFPEWATRLANARAYERLRALFADGAPASRLATDWEIGDDGRTYTFTLKEGATFHNGEEVTAQDFEYSIKRLMVSQNSTNARFPVSVMGIEHETEEVTVTDEEGNTVTATDTGEPETTTRIIPDSIGVTAVDDYTLEITTENPFAFSLSVLAYSAFSAVPEGIVGDLEGYEGEMSWEEFSQSPVGAGPFEFVNWESGNGGEFVMDTFDDYHGDGASFDGIDAAILTETQARYNYFLNENADVGGVPTAQYQADSVSIEETDDLGRDLGTYELDNGTTVNYARTPEIGTFYVGFNMEAVPRAVRQAMAYVVNQPEFMQNVFKSRFEPAYHLTPPQIFPGGIEAYDEHVGSEEASDPLPPPMTRSLSPRAYCSAAHGQRQPHA